jgi:hypothetical protein
MKSQSYVKSNVRDASVNCFYGALSCCARLKNIELSESDIFCFGNGYRLSIIEDEYGMPELSCLISETIDELIKKLNITVEKVHLDLEDSEKQIKDILSNFGPFVSLVNTSGLSYLTDKYARVGYTHAVAVIGVLEGNVILEDHFIGNIKPYAAKIVLPLEEFIDSVRSVYEFDQYTQKGVFNIPQFGDFSGISIGQRRARLKDISESFLSKSNLKTVLDSHYSLCIDLIASGSSLESIFGLLAYDISTDHVIPSRKLLRETLYQSGLETSLLEESITDSIKQWNVLALTARYFSKKNEFDPNKLLFRYENVVIRELNLWRSISKSLN